MKFISENTVFESWKELIEFGEVTKASLNKFFGLLELLQHIDLSQDKPIESNFQYQILSSQLSNSLQEKYFFDENNKKAFSSQDSLNIIFPSNWTQNIFQIFLKGNSLPLRNVAVVCLQNEVFEDTIRENDIINSFLGKFHLHAAVDIFFTQENTNNIQVEISRPNRQTIFNKLKQDLNISDDSKFTIGFDKLLISANPGELTRGPFIQPLYSGQENLKCLILANFNLLEFYQIGSINTPNKLNENLIQKIFYGAPGTGKSHKVTELVRGNEERTERVTFHPEYDYASFVGGYKPTMDGKDIRYEFVPQVFTNIYMDAWNSLALDEKLDFYLVIEEINRGNCAEIFGDVFQLLDRSSDYDITPSKELKEFLMDEKKGLINVEYGLKGGKLKLPPNLNILATMNTSDQSLFPMDSAFKRRWDWEYIPINYEFSEDNQSSKFRVKISENESFSWLSFIKSVNDYVKQNDNLGMDKCIGNYFIKPADEFIELETFINKALFYLWNDVFKDEIEEQNIFKNKVTYEDFFPIEPVGIEKLKEILSYLSVEINDSAAE